MAIGVLIPSASELEASVEIGLDIASHLDQPMVALCLRPEKTPTGPAGDKVAARSARKRGTADPPASANADEQRFLVRGGYVDQARDIIAEVIAKHRFGLPASDVVEIPSDVSEIRKWLRKPCETPQLGTLKIDTLVIPVFRGTDSETNRDPASRLFETAPTQTLLVLVSPEWTRRLPLETILVAGATKSDLQIAVRLGHSLNRQARLREIDEVDKPDRHMLIIGIPGKANRTHLDNCEVWNKWRRDPRFSAIILVNPYDSWLERLSTSIDEKIRSSFADYQMSRERRVELSGKLENGAKSSPEFFLFMAVATFLASIGLIQDSAAVIIGAMLVAP